MMAIYPIRLKEYYFLLNRHFRYFSSHRGNFGITRRGFDLVFVDDAVKFKQIEFDVIITEVFSNNTSFNPVFDAETDLIKKIKEYLRNNLKNGKNSILIWRTMPEIECQKDHEKDCIHYRGYTRLAIYNG